MNNSSSPLFPPLNDPKDMLWSNVNTFTIPDAESNSNSNTPTLSNIMKYESSPSVEDNTSFNISWGGNDRPPAQLHPEEKEVEEPIKLSRPLPKPRGIRRLPEPAPSEDGTIDEDTLKRRKNTDAARRSRMKKFLKVDQLETKVSSLQAENAKLILNNAVLESEKKTWIAKEHEYQKRIRYLEDLTKS